MNKANFGIFVGFPFLAGSVFFIVSLLYGVDLQMALMLGGAGAIMGLCLSVQALPDTPPKPVVRDLKKRGLERKLDFLRRSWESSPVALVFTLLIGIAFGALMLGGFLVSLLYWALGYPEPFSQPILRVPGSGSYDKFIFLLSGILFTWTIFIPMFDWFERLEMPKGSEADEDGLQI